MRNIISALFFISTLVLSSQNKTNKYFKHLVFRETPYSEIKGRIPITKERAQKENNYKLTYNALGKLILVEYNINNKLIGTRRSGMLDGNRNLMPKTKIEYSENKEIRTFYDEYNNQRKNFMGVYKEVYKYNENNKKISLKHYDENNSPVNNNWKIFEYFWTHLNGNDVIEKRKNVAGQFVSMRSYYHFKTVLYEFSNEGILQSMNNIDEAGNLIEEETGVAMDVPVYDKDFNIVSYKFLNAKKEPVVGTFIGAAGGIVEYDINGNVTQYRTVDLEGKPMVGNREYVFRNYTFDKYGNVAERAFYGLNKELVPVRDIVKVKYTYSNEDPSKLFKSEYYHTTLKK